MNPLFTLSNTSQSNGVDAYQFCKRPTLVTCKNGVNFSNKHHNWSGQFSVVNIFAFSPFQGLERAVSYSVSMIRFWTALVKVRWVAAFVIPACMANVDSFFRYAINQRKGNTVGWCRHWKHQPEGDVWVIAFERLFPWPTLICSSPINTAPEPCFSGRVTTLGLVFSRCFDKLTGMVRSHVDMIYNEPVLST